MNPALWEQLPAYISAFGVLITAYATYLLWKSTQEMAKSTIQMADATKNMEEISKHMEQASDKSVKSQAAVTMMQMLNEADYCAISNEENLRISNDLIKDEVLEEMMKEIDNDREKAMRKIWIAFVWLNTQQSHLFMKELIPQGYGRRSYNQVLGKMLQYKYIRYLVSNRGYYDLFINLCIEIYEATGQEWEEEWKHNI